jgi:hypothetical protein
VANQNDVRRIAASLPGTYEVKGRFAFTVHNGKKEKGFVWVWMERIDPKKARVPNPKMLAVRVANLDDKVTLLALDKEKFFTEPHYDGFPAVPPNALAARRERRARVLALTCLANQPSRRNCRKRG